MPGAFGRRCGRGGSRGRNKVCAQDFAAAFEEELARFVAPGTADSLDFEALETGLRRKALAEAARLLEECLNADLCDHTGPRQPCSCGGAAHFAGRRRKTFMSALGPVTLERAYYHCTACGHGRFPWDEALGMAGTDLSPAVQRIASTAASMVSFAEASTLLEELAGVPVGTKHVERTAEAVGRKGRQEDGTARTREVKLVLVWTAEQRDEEGRPQRDPGSVSYSAAVESAAASPPPTARS